MQARKHPVITHTPSPLPCKDTLPSFLPRVSNLSEEPIPGAWLPLCVGPIALVRAGGHHSEQPPQGVLHSRLPLYLTVRGMGVRGPRIPGRKQKVLPYLKGLRASPPGLPSAPKQPWNALIFIHHMFNPVLPVAPGVNLRLPHFVYWNHRLFF